jgi:hypothetical protein
MLSFLRILSFLGKEFLNHQMTMSILSWSCDHMKRHLNSRPISRSLFLRPYLLTTHQSTTTPAARQKVPHNCANHPLPENSELHLFSDPYLTTLKGWIRWPVLPNWTSAMVWIKALYFPLRDWAPQLLKTLKQQNDQEQLPSHISSQQHCSNSSHCNPFNGLRIRRPMI